jgi:hypothetical protein
MFTFENYLVRRLSEISNKHVGLYEANCPEGASFSALVAEKA